MGSIERRERERNEKREMILVAAMRLFLEESFEKTTMRRIADAIEYTPGALYSYFKDKDELLYALHERGFDELVARMEDSVERLDDPRERIAALGRAYIGFALENPQWYELMFMAKSTTRTIQENATWECGHQAYSMLGAEIARYLAHKGSSIDPEITTFACWAQVHGIVSLVIAERTVLIPLEQLPLMITATYEHFVKMLDCHLSSESG